MSIHKIACSEIIYEKIKNEVPDLSGSISEVVAGTIPNFSKLNVHSVEGMPDNEWLLVTAGMDLKAFEMCIKDVGYAKAKIIFHKWGKNEHHKGLQEREQNQINVPTG